MPLSLMLGSYCVGCNDGDQSGKGEGAQATTAPAVLVDEPLGDSARKLLDIAFSAVSAIPEYPHVKDRSRYQESVVAACLELGQPVRAAAYAESVANWRRNCCYADIAFYCARNGNSQKAQQYLDKASHIPEGLSDWRKNTIKAKIARADTWLRHDTAGGQGAGQIKQSATVAQVNAMLCDEESLDAQLASIDGWVATGEFEAVKSAVTAYAEPVSYTHLTLPTN